jgi:hypothetical protein
MKARIFVSSMIGISIAAAASAAAASETCTRAPREQWKSETEARAAAESMGYKVVRIKADDGCYEVKADKGGRRYEIKFDPTDLRVVTRYQDESSREVVSR